MGAIKAFHGSPHKFDAFDMSKIGTGEGAQAYGHGLYFAEDPAVAGSYQKNLANYWESPEQVARSYLDDAGSKDEAIKLLQDHARGGFGASPEEMKNIRMGLELLQSGKDVGPVDKPGALYETSLEWPDPAREASDPLGPQHFLDWDKPLSEQPEGIQRALQVVDPDSYHPSGDDYDAAELGQSIYNRLLNQKRDYNIAANRNSMTTLGASQAGASDDLLSFGIPGIRYLDQGSRGAGDGTYNYVIFDQDIPKIISRNGVSLRELYGR
jgi:hypothetical protein